MHILRNDNFSSSKHERLSILKTSEKLSIFIILVLIFKVYIRFRSFEKYSIVSRFDKCIGFYL